MRDDLFELTKAFCNYRRAPNLCTLKGVGPMCAVGVCPVLAAAERVVEGMRCQSFTDGWRQGLEDAATRKEPTPESSTDNPDSGDGDGL